MIEGEKRWDKQKERRNIAQERSNKSQSWGKQGCKKGLGLEVISGDEPTLKWTHLCVHVPVLELNKFTVWEELVWEESTLRLAET